MWRSFSPPREAATTIQCGTCATPLIARRNCHEAWLHCPSCVKDYALRDYVAVMDAQLERFLEALNCDRV